MRSVGRTRQDWGGGGKGGGGREGGREVSRDREHCHSKTSGEGAAGERGGGCARRLKSKREIKGGQMGAGEEREGRGQRRNIVGDAPEKEGWGKGGEIERGANCGTRRSHLQ